MICITKQSFSHTLYQQAGFVSVCSRLSFCCKATHMKPIRRCWNVVHRSGVDLWSWIEEGGGSMLRPSWWWCLEASITELLNWCHTTIYSLAPSCSIPTSSSQPLRLLFGLHKTGTTLKLPLVNEWMALKLHYQALGKDVSVSQGLCTFLRLPFSIV